MDTTQWAQGLGFMKRQIGEDQLLVPSSIITDTGATNAATRTVPVSQQQLAAERKARPPQKEQALHCPRCNSTNTKFCYYNNYSLTQPRYICKACRRYWTEGGSLRNVPVGGGSRKNKRHSAASHHPPSTASAAAIPSSNIKNHHHIPPQIPSSSSSPPSLFPTAAAATSSSQPFSQVHDLNLAYPNYNHNFLSAERNNVNNTGNGSTSGMSPMELLRSTGIPTGGLGPLMPMHMPMSMAPAQESSLFPFDGSVGSSMQEEGRRLLFPFGDLKQEQHRGHGGDQQPMFWNGMMGGGAGAGSW